MKLVYGEAGLGIVVEGAFEGGGESGTSSVGAVSGVSTFTFLVNANFDSGTTFGKSSKGFSAIAAFMNPSQIGRAALAPVSPLPKEC